MNTHLSIHGAAEVKFAAYSYSAKPEGMPGGWLEMKATDTAGRVSCTVVLHTQDPKVLDHFNDIVRALEGPLVPEPTEGEPPFEGEAWEPSR